MMQKTEKDAVKVGRRYKIYSSETGVSYQYFFDARRAVVRPEGQGAGFDFLFAVVADQNPPFTLRVFVSGRALASWRAAHQRDLTHQEHYAAAKMRLFRAFDEAENLAADPLGLIVDETNVIELLEALGLE